MIRRVAALAAAMLLASGCATTGSAPDPRDPLEPMNRAVFEFNDGLDRALIKPTAEAYRFVTPQIVRTGVTNFFGNLQDIWIGTNQLLQGKVENWINDWARVLFNSTFGAAGLVDIASEMRLEKHDEDFGQTLGVWGFQPGAYVVLPIFGPSSVRDAAGFAVDFYMYPTFWILRNIRPEHWVSWRNSLAGLAFINNRTNALAVTDVLEQAALDRYTYVRSAYFQRRLNQVYDGNPPPDKSAGLPAIPTKAAAELMQILDALDQERADASRSPFSRETFDPRIPMNYDAVLDASARSARVVADGGPALQEKP
jgi:phospholipid-binding lipoprotein MlaA